MELAIPIAIVAIVLLIPSIFLLLRMLKTTGELRQLDADLATKTKELEHANTQLESAGEDSAAAQQLRVEVAGLQQQLNDKNAALARADASSKTLEAKRDELQTRVQELVGAESQLRQQVKEISAQLGDRDHLEKRFTDAFDALAGKSLKRTQESLTLAANETLKEREAAVKKLVDPLSQKVDALEKARVEGTTKIEEQIKMLAQSKDHLAEQTNRLSSALQHKPQVRGQWGEMQVERALELGGLVKGKHYFPQSTLEDGLRPDFIVKMPHERDLAIDSKVPLNAYLEAEAADNNDAREAALRRHADAVHRYAEQLGQKAYQDKLESSIDYTVMVVPEFALAPAEQHHHDLIVRALKRKVLITTHSNLVALVSTVALGWKERVVFEEARNVATLGIELHDRLTVYAGHVNGVGRALSQAVDRYNDSIGSFERNVLTSANRFPELGVQVTKEMPSANMVDAKVRPMTKLEPTAIDAGNGYDSES